jgi:hypothetical protein
MAPRVGIPLFLTKIKSLIIHLHAFLSLSLSLSLSLFCSYLDWPVGGCAAPVDVF